MEYTGTKSRIAKRILEYNINEDDSIESEMEIPKKYSLKYYEVYSQFKKKTSSY